MPSSVYGPDRFVRSTPIPPHPIEDGTSLRDLPQLRLQHFIVPKAAAGGLTVTVEIFAGEPQAAVEVVQALMRLDPYYHPLASGWLGLAYYHLKRYSKALAPLRECLSRMPNYRSARAWLAATYAQLGLQQEARAEITEVLRIDPKHSIDGYYRRIPPYKVASDADHLFDGLRKAGLPER